MADQKYTKKNLMRMKRVELLAIADAQRINLGKLKRLTRHLISDEIVTQLASRPVTISGSIVDSRGVKGIVGYPPDPNVSIRIKRMREQNREAEERHPPK